MDKVKESGTPEEGKTVVRVIECRTLTEEEATRHAFEQERVFTNAEKTLIKKVFSKFKFSRGKSWEHYKQGYRAYSSLKKKFERQIIAYYYYLYRVKQGDPAAVPVSEPSKEFTSYIKGIIGGYHSYEMKIEEYNELSKIEGLIEDNEIADESIAPTADESTTKPEDDDPIDINGLSETTKAAALYFLIKKLQKDKTISGLGGENKTNELDIARFIAAITGVDIKSVKDKVVSKVVGAGGKRSRTSENAAKDLLKKYLNVEID